MTLFWYKWVLLANSVSTDCPFYIHNAFVEGRNQNMNTGIFQGKFRIKHIQHITFDENKA